jgi:uncharacterized protein (TIGR02594 family)
MFCPADTSPYPWMKFALQEYGTTGIVGPGSNARIGEYLKTVGLGPDDDTPWCSAFANWCMVQAGIPGTGKGNARSWLQWSEAKISLAAPVWGCVTILWREDPKSYKGHVGFYTGTTGNKIQLLGGNQHNSVSIKESPKSEVLGYRWPSSLPMPYVPG